MPSLKETVFSILDSREIFKTKRMTRMSVVYSIIGQEEIRGFIRAVKFFAIEPFDLVNRVYTYVLRWEKKNGLKFAILPPVVEHAVYGKCTRRTLLEILRKQ